MYDGITKIRNRRGNGIPIPDQMKNGPKMVPKPRETAVKYDNKRCELIENAKADKVY
jgi:hypothetical protein